MKYTPGPWKSEENRVFQVEHSTFRVAICTSNIAEYSEEVANAKLIAAAPDLLEACKITLEIKKLMDESGGATFEVEGLEQAIAKAEGEK